MSYEVKWKKFVLAKPLWTWDHKYEIYQLGRDPDWPFLYVSLNDSKESGVGYTKSTIEEHCGFDWYFFDHMEDADQFLKELYHPRFVRYPKDGQQVAWCPECWRAYSVINEDWEYDDSTTHDVRIDCVCGCSISTVVSVTRIVTYKLDTRIIKGK